MSLNIKYEKLFPYNYLSLVCYIHVYFLANSFFKYILVGATGGTRKNCKREGTSMHLQFDPSTAFQPQRFYTIDGSEYGGNYDFFFFVKKSISQTSMNSCTYVSTECAR